MKIKLVGKTDLIIQEKQIYGLISGLPHLKLEANILKCKYLICNILCKIITDGVS
jgi:hypothetical protein